MLNSKKGGTQTRQASSVSAGTNQRGERAAPLRRMRASGIRGWEAATELAALWKKGVNACSQDPAGETKPMPGDHMHVPTLAVIVLTRQADDMPIPWSY